MTALRAFVGRRPVLCYYALVFAISWGAMLVVIAGSEFPASTETYDSKFGLVIVALIAGPTFSSLGLTALLRGKAGFKDLLLRLLKWRVGGEWYRWVLLAPAIIAAVVTPLWLISSDYRPGFETSDDPASLLIAGVFAGLGGGLAEEIGWTGFVIPRLKTRLGPLRTGLTVGFLWSAWHLLVNVWACKNLAADEPLALFLPLYVIAAVAQLTVFRVLMVWVYEHTESLLLSVLMHASLIVSTFAILAPDTDGVPWLVWYWAFTALMCAVVLVIALRSRSERTNRARSAASNEAVQA